MPRKKCLFAWPAQGVWEFHSHCCDTVQAQAMRYWRDGAAYRQAHETLARQHAQLAARHTKVCGGARRVGSYNGKEEMLGVQHSRTMEQRRIGLASGPKVSRTPRFYIGSQPACSMCLVSFFLVSFLPSVLPIQLENELAEARELLQQRADALAQYDRLAQMLAPLVVTPATAAAARGPRRRVAGRTWQFAAVLAWKKAFNFFPLVLLFCLFLVVASTRRSCHVGHRRGGAVWRRRGGCCPVRGHAGGRCERAGQGTDQRTVGHPCPASGTHTVTPLDWSPPRTCHSLTTSSRAGPSASPCAACKKVRPHASCVWWRARRSLLPRCPRSLFLALRRLFLHPSLSPPSPSSAPHTPGAPASAALRARPAPRRTAPAPARPRCRPAPGAPAAPLVAAAFRCRSHRTLATPTAFCRSRSRRPVRANPALATPAAAYNGTHRSDR